MAVNTFSCNQVGLFNVGNYGHKWLLQELQFLALSPEPIFFFFFPAPKVAACFETTHIYDSKAFSIQQ